MRSIAEYVRRQHIGLLALFVALGGTAYAVQNAPNNSVVSKSIKNGQVKPQDVNPAKTIEYPDQIVLGSQETHVRAVQGQSAGFRPGLGLRRE